MATPTLPRSPRSRRLRPAGLLGALLLTIVLGAAQARFAPMAHAATAASAAASAAPVASMSPARAPGAPRDPLQDTPHRAAPHPARVWLERAAALAVGAGLPWLLYRLGRPRGGVASRARRAATARAQTSTSTVESKR